MNRLFLFFLAPLLLIVRVTGADWVTLTPNTSPGTPPTIRAISCDVKGTVLEIKVPGFWAEKTSDGYLLRLPTGLVTTTLGRPELPFIGCTLALPELRTPKLVIRRADFKLPGNFRLRMAPQHELEGQTNRPPGPFAPQIDFPPAPLRIAHTGYWREVPQISLQIHPFRARGDGHLTGVASRMIVEILHQQPPPTWPDTVVPQEFQSLLQSTCINGKAVKAIVSPVDAPATEYLVLGPAKLKPGVADLLKWRQEQGFQAEYVTLTSSSSTATKNHILTRYTGNKLKFIVLVGDYVQIPYSIFGSTCSDMWYACLTGGTNPDLFPDCGLGRLSGTTVAEISHQVDKIIKYETNPPGGTWHKKTVLVAHREQAPGKYVGCSEEIAKGPLGTSGWTIIKQYGNDNAVSNNTVSNHIDGGVGLVNYRGHGSTTSWINGWCNVGGSYNVTLVQALTNGAITPIVLNIACDCAKFKSACLQEAWLQSKDAAVASLGAILPSYTAENHIFDKELYRAIFQDGDTNIYAFWYKAVAKLIAQGSYGKKNAKMYWWGGDAATCMWSKAPSKLTALHTTGIYTGPNNCTVTVTEGTKALAGAQVCLHKDPDVFVVGTTSATGTIVIPIIPTSAGTVAVTVTKKDYLPYRGKIDVGAINPTGEILPTGLAKTEGNTALHLPTRYAPSRSQHIYDGAILTNLSTGAIKSISLRRDGMDATSFVSHKFNLDVYLSSMGVPGQSAWSKTSYLANRGLDWTHTAKATTIDFPATAKPLAPPAIFSVSIPFTAPFLYLKGQNLLVQFEVNHTGPGKANHHWLADAQSYPAAGQAGSAVKYGTGCPPKLPYVGSAPAITGTTKLNLYWHSGGGYSTPALAFLGNNDKNFGPLPLPLFLTGMGATGCSLNTNFIINVPGMTDATGTNGCYQVTLPLPHLKELAGVVLFGQILVSCPSYNTAGIMLSEGMKFTLGTYGGPSPALHLYSYNSTPPFPDKPLFTNDSGLVMEVVR